MSILLVTPFAPYRDGIATYAAQELRRLRNDGHDVEVLSPVPSAAHHHLPLGGVRGAAMLVKRATRYERVIVQFGPELLFGRCRAATERVAVWTSLAAMARATRLDLRLHEVEYGPLDQNPAERRAARLALRWADRVTVHTEPERVRLSELLGPVTDRVEIIDHGVNFVPAVTCTAAEAKAELGLPADEFVFLSIGFLQHHKGFDRAVEAFTLADLPRSSLHIVGSGRVDHPDIGRYVASLERICARTSGVELHNRYVSDDQFDLWLTAADAVVLPYREIWSSGVVERARLFDKPVIASDLQQLRHQLSLGGGGAWFTAADVGEFAVAMEKVWSSAGYGHGDERGSAASSGSAPAGAEADRTERRRSMRPLWDVDDEAPDRGAIQAQIVARARATLDGNGDAEVPVARPGLDSPCDGERPSDGLRALGPLVIPEPVSARPGVTPVKQTVRRLTGWQLDPMNQRLAALQQATVDAVIEMEARLERLSEALDDPTR